MKFMGYRVIIVKTFLASILHLANWIAALAECEGWIVYACYKNSGRKLAE